MVIKTTYSDNTEIELNNIDEIYDLKNPKNVIKIDLSYNNLTTVPENIFSSLTQLQELDLSNNNLTTLPDNIFNNLTQLHTLNLLNNNLTALPLSIIRTIKYNKIKSKIL